MIVLLIQLSAAADVVHLVIGALNMEPSENRSLDNPQMLGFVEFMSFTNQFKFVGRQLQEDSLSDRYRHRFYSRFLHSNECHTPCMTVDNGC